MVVMLIVFGGIGGNCGNGYKSDSGDTIASKSPLSLKLPKPPLLSITSKINITTKTHDLPGAMVVDYP